MEDMTLSELYNRGNRLYERLVVEQSLTGDDAVGEAVTALETCIRRVRVEGLFSANEELDDYSSGSLRFLLLEYFLGKVHAQFVQLDGRGGHLSVARELLIEYLERCKMLRILHEEEVAALNALTGDDGDSESERGGAALRSQSAADQRSRKIAKFKREKDARERISTLKQLLSSSSSSLIADGTETGTALDREEEARELVLLQLQAAARDCLDEVPLMMQEQAMLAHMAQLRAASNPSDRLDQDQEKAKKRPDQQQHQHQPANQTHHLAPSLDPNRPGLTVTRTSLSSDGQLVMHRETVKASVFSPSLAPPSMTLEQFADIEVAAALERQQTASAAAATAATHKDPSRRYEQLERDGDEDDAAAVERAAANDRAWDDWREDNPKGSGNKLGKRF